MDGELLIQLNGLPDGGRDFHWDLGIEFFAIFGNSDILDAAVGVDVRLEKSGDRIELDVDLDAKVSVPCDRCLSPLSMEVRERFGLSVRFGSMDVTKEGATHQSGEDGRDFVYLPEAAESLDIGQDVYDYTCLSLPSRKVHPHGQCDPDVARFIGESMPAASGNNPFESLGDMLKDLRL